jgi:hypothetical protein
MGDEFYPFDLYFQYQIQYMYAGIEATMTNKTVHLCALGLSVYTEILGGLVTGNLKKGGQKRKNYDAFLPYLGLKYVELDDELKLRGSSLYREVRSALVHQFTPDIGYALWLDDLPEGKPGLEYPSFGDPPTIQNVEGKTTITFGPHRHLNFHVKPYYWDFKNGVQKYYSELKAEMKKPAGPGQWPLFEKFSDATVIRAF